MKKVVVIVDGFNAGRFFPIRLKQRGYDCLHISSINMRNKQYDKSQYIDHIIEQLNVEDTLHLLKGVYQVQAVIAGSESGVVLAHTIARELNLPRNNDQLAHAARDKFAMQQVLEMNNVPYTSSLKSGDLDSISLWVNNHKKYPVVVKPVDSGGSDNVYICHDQKQVDMAYHQIKANKTIYGSNSTEVLVQEYLSGAEYVVNLVSCAGNHFLVEIRKYHKQFFNGKHIYDYEELLDFNGDLQNSLVNYAKKVANAIGIAYGPSHIEIIMTNDGPKLVEIAARISGATNMEVSNETLGYNVIDLTIDSYLDKIVCLNNKRLKSEMILDVATNKQGKIVAIPLKNNLSKFESIKSAHFKLEIGDTITPTVSLPTSPVKFHLVNVNREKLLREIETLKQDAMDGFVVA